MQTDRSSLFASLRWATPLLALALAACGTSGGGQGGRAEESPRPRPVATPTPRATPAPRMTPIPTPMPTPRPTPRPTPTPTPSPTPTPAPTPPPAVVAPPPAAAGGQSGPTRPTASAGERAAYLAKPYPRIKVSRSSEAGRDPQFQQMLTGFQQAVSQRDLDALLKFVDPQRIASGAGSPGMASFLTHWKLTYTPRNSDLWGELEQALELGVGWDASRQQFFAPSLETTAPYADTILKDNIEPADRGVVTGAKVNVRSEPGLKGEVVDQLSYEVVKLAGDADPASQATIGGTTALWWPITLYDGKKAFIFGKYLRKWNGPVARFEKVDNAWKLVSFAPRED